MAGPMKISIITSSLPHFSTIPSKKKRFHPSFQAFPKGWSTKLSLLLPNTKDVLRVYVEFGANLEAQDNGQLTALLWAAVNGNEGDRGESCAKAEPLLSITNARCFLFPGHLCIYHVCSYLLPIPLSLHCPKNQSFPCRCRALLGSQWSQHWSKRWGWNEAALQGLKHLLPLATPYKNIRVL